MLRPALRVYIHSMDVIRYRSLRTACNAPEIISSTYYSRATWWNVSKRYMFVCLFVCLFVDLLTWFTCRRNSPYATRRRHDGVLGVIDFCSRRKCSRHGLWLIRSHGVSFRANQAIITRKSRATSSHLHWQPVQWPTVYQLLYISPKPKEW